MPLHSIVKAGAGWGSAGCAAPGCPVRGRRKRPMANGGASRARFLACGDTALVVEFGNQVDRALSERVLSLNAALVEARLPGVVETVPTFRSLMVHYDPLATGAAELESSINRLLEASREVRRQASLWRVPVCYEPPYALDLAEVAARVKLGPEEVVARHSRKRYHVYMIGFLPGLPYLGDLDDRLVLPRRAEPRVRVPAGSVAIATTLTVIYPMESPGGWHVLGATPLALFTPGREPPALFAPGDAVLFEPVDGREFEAVRARVEAGSYELARRALCR